jgi:hypothetical protein
LSAVESGDVFVLSIKALLRHENASTDLGTLAKSISDLFFRHGFSRLSAEFSSVVDDVA